MQIRLVETKYLLP